MTKRTVRILRREPRKSLDLARERLRTTDLIQIVRKTNYTKIYKIQLYNYLTFSLAVQCAIPDNPANGRAFYTSVSFNSVVKYECRYGFKLMGSSTRTCNTNKQWEGDDPVCEGKIICKDRFVYSLFFKNNR